MVIDLTEDSDSESQIKSQVRFSCGFETRTLSLDMSLATILLFHAQENHPN
jgi:hypothetical protein